MKARVRVIPQAEAQADAIDAWWREKRSKAPACFAEELAAALELLSDAPAIGRRYERDDVPGLRRLMLPTTRHHVYYVHDADAAEVVVLAVWSAARGTGPKF